MTVAPIAFGTLVAMARGQGAISEAQYYSGLRIYAYLGAPGHLLLLMTPMNPSLDIEHSSGPDFWCDLFLTFGSQFIACLLIFNLIPIGTSYFRSRKGNGGSADPDVHT
jgi:hypothetical protein